MLTFRVENHQLRIQSRAAARAIQAAQPALLGLIGREVLADLRQDFAIKSAGGTANGITWSNDALHTIAARVRKSVAGRRIVLARHQLAQQIRETRGPGSAKKIQELRRRLAVLAAQLKSLIDDARQHVSIGVSSGALENSLDTSIDSQDHAVSIGFGVDQDYQYPFDAARQLVGPELEPATQTRIESQIHDRYEAILQQEFS